MLTQHSNTCYRKAREHNRLEILRDPSHTRCLSRGELVSLVEGQERMRVVEGEEEWLEVGMDLEAWMTSTDTPPDKQEEIIQAMKIELDGGPKTGMDVYRDEGGRICFKHRWTVVVGVKI